MSNVTRSGAYGRPPDRIEFGGPVVAVLVAAVEFAVAWLASSSVMIFAALTGLVAMSVAVLVWPTLVMVLAFPASFGVWRVGPAAFDMSLADFTAALAVVASLPFVPWRAKAFRTVLKVMLAYCLIVAVSVVANPSAVAAVEVVHRFVMVVGAVCIGSAVVNVGKATAALRALLVFATYFAIAAIVDAFARGFDPAYPLGVQKNAAGSMLTVALLVIVFASSYLRWPKKLTVPMGLVLLGGLAATQSRGAMFSLVAVVGVFAARTVWRQRDRRMLRLIVVMLIPAIALGALASMSLQENIDSHQGSDRKYGSIGSRERTYNATVDNVIKPNLLVGAGPKWFTKPGAPASTPHNVLLGELSDDGIVGTAAFLLLAWTLLRLTDSGGGSALGALAFYALLSRYLSTMADIFWVAGPNTLPFLMLGLAVGAAALRDGQSRPTVLYERDAVVAS